jgi:hypothetical protein
LMYKIRRVLMKGQVRLLLRCGWLREEKLGMGIHIVWMNNGNLNIEFNNNLST